MKLLSVEYNPLTSGKKNPMGNSSQAIEPLIGAIGETFAEWLYSREDGSLDDVPVRFPLLTPGARSQFSLLRSYPLDKLLFKEQSIDLSAASLCETSRLPVSLYERRQLTLEEDLLEKPIYMSTYGLEKFISFLQEIHDRYRLCWLWKRELVKGEKTVPSLFVEARFYGADNVVFTYDRRSFNGMAVEIIHRPWPTQSQWKEGMRVARCESDVFLVSDRRDYIEYIDGISINQKQTELGKIIESYSSNLVNAKQAQEVRKELEENDGSLKKKKDKSKSYYPASSAFKSTTTNTWVNTSSTGNF